MSAIQTQLSLIHLQAGLSVPSITQRTSIGSQFASNAIEVTTADETIPLGDVVTPKQVMVKLVSGDPLRIGLDGSTYPFRLVDADETMLLRLDVEGLVETSFVETIADVAGSLNDKYFTLEDRNGEVKVVITNDGVTALTSTGRVVVVTITNGDSDEAVATAIITAFAGDAEIAATAGPSSILVGFIDNHTGSRTNVSAGDSGFSVSTDQGGAASPVVHLKSIGTSQVVVAVAPH